MYAHPYVRLHFRPACCLGQSTGGLHENRISVGSKKEHTCLNFNAPIKWLYVYMDTCNKHCKVNHVYTMSIVHCTHRFLGWNWDLRTGDGNPNLRSISPDTISQRSTFQSVEDESSLCPLLFQLSGVIGWTCPLHSRDPMGHEVPYGNAAIVAPNSK